MSQQKPKTITLRQVPEDEAGVLSRNPAYYVSAYSPTGGPHISDIVAGRVYREVSPIPEGFEVCDLADATKVLIGETWCDVNADRCIHDGSGSLLLIGRFLGLGVLAIRPIPEPVQPPLTGEVRVGVASLFGVTSDKFGLVCFAPGLIGKTIRWEVVKDGGE